MAMRVAATMASGWLLARVMGGALLHAVVLCKIRDTLTNPVCPAGQSGLAGDDVRSHLAAKCTIRRGHRDARDA